MLGVKPQISISMYVMYGLQMRFACRVGISIDTGPTVSLVCLEIIVNALKGLKSGNPLANKLKLHHNYLITQSGLLIKAFKTNLLFVEALENVRWNQLSVSTTPWVL